MSVISGDPASTNHRFASLVVGSHHKDNIERVIQKWEAHHRNAVP
jgi:hypothetical protein